jgi:hypothetical protein
MKMKTILMMLMISAGLSAQGAFTLIEDFSDSDFSNWSRNGASANTLTENSGVGELLMTSNTSTSHFIELGSNAIADGATGTIFFQILTPTTGSLDHFAGFTVSNSPVAYSGYNGYVFSQDSGGPYDFDVRNGTSASGSTDSFAASTTYNIWMVVDNSAKTYDVYVNTGTAAATAGDLLWDDMAFRTNTSPAGEAVDTFGLFGQNSSGGNDLLSFDNIYVDSASSNLAYAVPEPGTLALVGIALGSLLLFRRRRG